MVNKFEVGKWYAHNPYDDLNRLWYIKYSRINDRNQKLASEYISDSKVYSANSGQFTKEQKTYLYKVKISENLLSNLIIW